MDPILTGSGKNTPGLFFQAHRTTHFLRAHDIVSFWVSILCSWCYNDLAAIDGKVHFSCLFH